MPATNRFPKWRPDKVVMRELTEIDMENLEYYIKPMDA